MKLRQIFRKIAIVFVFEVIVYLLAYVVEPFTIEMFDISGSWLTGGWVFYDIVGAWVNLLIVPVLTFLVMWNYAKEPWYWLLWIPVYFLMKLIYYTSEIYLPMKFEGIHYDSAAVTVLVMQYFTWITVMIATGIRTLRRRKKEK